MSGFARKITSAAVVAGLTLVPAGAFASTPPSATPVAATAASSNPWLTLSAMTSTSSSTAATTAAAQGEGDGVGFPPIIPLAIILATIAVAIWIAVDDGNDLDIEISPD